MRARPVNAYPTIEFPSSWHITKTEKHWSNEHSMRDYFEKITFLYIDEKRSELKLSNEQPSLLIFDNFKAQCMPPLLHLLDRHNANVVLIPPNCTDRLHPLDLCVNKAAKDFYVESLENGMQSKCVYNWMEHRTNQ